MERVGYIVSMKNESIQKQTSENSTSDSAALLDPHRVCHHDDATRRDRAIRNTKAKTYVSYMKLTALSIALLAILALSFTAAIVHADPGGNQIRIDSVTLTADQTNLIIVVSATINDPTVESVFFTLDVSYGTHHLNINKQGTSFATTNSTGNVVGLYASATFVVPFQGPGYYLIVTNAYNAANGALLGSAWVDPREGTAG